MAAGTGTAVAQHTSETRAHLCSMQTPVLPMVKGTKMAAPIFYAGRFRLVNAKSHCLVICMQIVVGPRLYKAGAFLFLSTEFFAREKVGRVTLFCRLPSSHFLSATIS